jgi:hypothetical protein
VQGTQGYQGNQGHVGAGIEWFGAWEFDFNYVVGRGVSHNGNSYVATAPSLDKEPPNLSYWDLLAEGSQGPQGAQGSQGPQGAQGTQGAQGAQGTINVTAGTADPAGGSDGDVYFQYV